MVKHRGPTRNMVAIRHASIFALIISAAGGFGAYPAAAAELAEQAHSLRAVPADAAFYSVSLRLKEQIDAFLASKAYDKLLEIPVIQMAKLQVGFQWQQAAVPGVAPFKEYVESPQGQEAVALLKEMFSDEIFMYGGADIISSLELFMELNGIRRTAQLEALASGKDANEVMTERAMEVLEQHADKFKVPSIVFGWRIKDAQRAERKLDEVHSLARHLLDEHYPEFSAHLQRDQIAGHEFLTLRLDGSMIPWDQLREETEDMDPEQFDKWQQLLSTKTLAVALGLVDEFVLLSIGDSTDHLETFGQGESVAGQRAIERLNKHAEERVASLGFVSKALSQNLNSPEKTVEDLAAAAEEILQAAEVGEEQRAQLVEDIRSFGNEVKKYLPEPGDLSTITFLTERGYEGYQYRDGPQTKLDSSQPLTILDHVGGSPMLLVATRSKENVEDYENAVEWVKRIAVQVEAIVKTKVDPELWARYEQYRDRGVDLLRRLDKANREHLMPAFREGQTALVIDASAESQRWIKQMPKSPKPLPMLEFAVVSSVSDAVHLRQGAAECFEVVRDAIALVRDIDPENVPEFELPEPEKRELDGGVLYVYELPEEWGIDSQVAINAALGDSIAVVSASPTTSERLLRETTLELETSLDLNRPTALVSYVQFAKGIAAIRPWVDYGFDVALGKLKVEEENEDEELNGEGEADEAPDPEQAAMAMQMGFIVPQIHQFLEVATALRSFSSVSYEEDGVWVTHSETHLKDLE